MRSSARSALTVSGVAPGCMISTSRQYLSGRSGDSASQAASRNTVSASAKVGWGREGSPCACAHNPAIEVSSSIAAQSSSTSRSKALRPSRCARTCNAGGGTICVTPPRPSSVVTAVVFGVLLEISAGTDGLIRRPMPCQNRRSAGTVAGGCAAGGAVGEM
jgi:hypothetical protein